MSDREIKWEYRPLKMIEGNLVRKFQKHRIRLIERDRHQNHVILKLVLKSR